MTIETHQYLRLSFSCSDIKNRKNCIIIHLHHGNYSIHRRLNENQMFDEREVGEKFRRKLIRSHARNVW